MSTAKKEILGSLGWRNGKNLVRQFLARGSSSEHFCSALGLVENFPDDTAEGDGAVGLLQVGCVGSGEATLLESCE